MQNFWSLCLVWMFLVFSGLNGTALAKSNPTLQDVRVSGPGSGAHMEIIADSPLTYTYYRMPDLLKVVIDLALVDPGQVSPVISSSGLISKITVEKKEVTTFSLTRIVINLESDADFSVHPDAGDRSRLMISFRPRNSAAVTGNTEDSHPEQMHDKIQEYSAAAPVGAPDTATPVSVPAPVPAPTPVSQPLAAAIPGSAVEKGSAAPAPEPLKTILADKRMLQPVVPQPNPSRTINGIRINNNSLEIVANSRLDDYKAFTLINPARLVIDVPMSKTPLAAKEIPLRRFGLSKARVGNYPDKVRMVFDADGSNFPSYRIDRNDKGLAIVFPAKK
ncbi:AMIN domain-containing protein [Geotalea toluenoxydans]